MTGMLTRYERLVAAGERLDRLQKDLEAESSGGLLSQLFRAKKANPQGVYMWGGVGRGKSMLMDLFVETLGIDEKRRVHFHEFMLEVDRRIRERRESDPGDPTGKVARDIAEDVRCLAFDEMVVNNTADAAIRVLRSSPPATGLPAIFTRTV